MSVIGLDIGNENCVVAVAKQRGIDILLNDESKRETPAVVSFSEKQRFMGSAGAASATMSPKSTISQVKRLIGRKFLELDPKELRTFPFETSEGPDGGVLINAQYLGESRTFTPVQIMAMLFSHLKQMAEKNLEIPLTDCVIGIPAYFTDLQRRAYLYAAAIAGLRPLRLMHDCTATALSYGIYKTDFTNAGPTYVVFVDIGHCDIQVCVASFEVGHLRIISHAFDRNLGGRDFDEVLFNYFAAQFKEQYKIDVNSSLRASFRLRTACEKLKKVLSANAVAPLNIECLMDEIDVKGYIKREEFENLSSSLLERIKVPCNKALVDAGLSPDKVHSLELVGSGSRIPAITRILSALFQREPSRTLNASECVARGCALQCAMLSPLFRVRDYEVQDSFPFSVGFSSDEGPICTLSNSILFPRGQLFPSVKMLTFHRANTFCLEAFYADDSNLPAGVSHKISSFTIGSFKASSNEKPKVKVKVLLNLHGIVTVESASLIAEADDAALSSSEKMEFEFDSRVSSDSVANVVENGTFAESKSEAAPAEKSTEVQSPSAQVDGTRKGRPFRRVELPVTETVYGGMPEDELVEAQQQEHQLAHQDRLMERTKEQKNALEANVYEIRNKLFDKYRSYATDSEREGISRSLLQTEEWLYEDGDDESENVYSDKLEELKKLVDPIENRYKDEEARVQATRNLLKRIVDYRMGAKSLGISERDMVNNECNKAEQWLREKTLQQEALPKNADPVLWSSEIMKKAEALETMCRQIMRPKACPPIPEDSKGADRAHTPNDMRTE